MKRVFAIAAAVLFASSAAFADDKPSDEEAAKIKDALSAWGCSGGEMEKETEGSSLFEVDDATCKRGGQFDFKLDKDFNVISVTRD